MRNQLSLIDMNFQNLPYFEKRVAFALMDITLKKLHDKNMMVTSFEPSKVYYQDGVYFFESVVPITNYYASNKEEAILRDLLGLSRLAFCSYLPNYSLQNGLLSLEVISNHFQDFSNIFPEEDKRYYQSILVDGYQKRKLPEVPYYYEYMAKLNQTGSSKATNLAYVKATEAGKAFTDKEEAAFGNTFFFLSVVASLTILLFGVVVYFWINFS